MKYHGTCVYLCIIYVFYRYILCHWERFLSSRMRISIALSRSFSFAQKSQVNVSNCFVFLLLFCLLSIASFTQVFSLPHSKCVCHALIARAQLYSIQVNSVNPSNHHCFKITMKEIGSFLFYFYF